jgi:hypothetical protein
MEPDGEASSTRRDNCLVIAGQNKPRVQQASSPNQGRVEHSQSNRAPSKSGGNHRTHIPATIAGSLEIQMRSPASRAIHLGLMQQSRHGARLWRMPRRLLEPGTTLKAPSRLGRM